MGVLMYRTSKNGSRIVDLKHLVDAIELAGKSEPRLNACEWWWSGSNRHNNVSVSDIFLVAAEMSYPESGKGYNWAKQMVCSVCSVSNCTSHIADVHDRT